MQKYARPSAYSKTKYRAPLFLLFGVLLSLFFLLTACGDSNNTTVPDSKQLIKQAQDAMKQVNSYHFNLTSDHPGTSSGIDLQTADGDALAPDKIQAKSTINLQGLPAQVNIIAIGQKDYYTIPFTTNWTTTNSGVDARKFADPQAGIGALLGNIQQPGTATDSPGNNCWSITGQLSTQYIAGILGSSAAQNGNVNTTVCIGKSDHHPYQLLINGPVIQGDTAQTTRTIKFSKFNDPVAIQAPSA